MVSTVTRDARHAVRMLAANPGFTLVAVLTFALGIGVNTAVFSVFNGVLLEPLPYPDPDRITMVWMDNRRQAIKEDITSYPNYRDWREQNQSYAHLAAFTDSTFSLTGADEPERVLGAQTTANFFDVMGVQPILGRLFTEANETPGQDFVALIGEGLWQRRYGGARDVLGKTITLNGNPHEIIGVLPATLQVPEKAELWKPLAPSEQLRAARGAFWLPAIGRLKPGVSVAQAQAEMSGISSRLEQAYPSNAGFGIYIVPLHQQLVGDIGRSLRLLLAAVGFVLLIACANLGNLMLGRTAARRKELAIRTALGAQRGRLVRQIVTEALVLALAGSVLGLVLAYWATGFFIALGGDTIPRPEAIGMDLRVLAFTFALAVLAALFSGVIPAWQASRPALTEHLREGGREGGAVSSRGTRSVLVAAEVALAFVLLAGSGLLVRSLLEMQHERRGFDPSRVAVMTVSLPQKLYPRVQDVRAFYAQLLDRVRALPGVESAATGTGVLMPLVTRSGIFSIEGKPLPPPEQRIEYPVENVSPGYFETLGIQLARGRTFDARDHADAPRAVIVNESMARLEWGDADPIGRRIRPGDDTSQAPWMTVVGVIKDVKRGDLNRGVRPELYLCTLQATPSTQMILVRTAGDPGAIVPSVRKEVQALNAQLPLYAVGTLSSSLSRTLTSPRFRATLTAAFAVIALLLATIGIYGVTSYAVGQRTQEVGVRMALGARASDVLRLIVSQHLRPALIGLAVGLAGSMFVSRWLRSLLYGVSAADPLTYAVMSFALIAVAALACWIPARRATRVDPLIALRSS